MRKGNYIAFWSIWIGKRNRFLLGVLCCFNLLFFTGVGVAQNKKRADSLKAVLDKGEHSDSVKYFLYKGISWDSGNPDEILLYATKALKIATKVENPFWVALIQLHFGDAYRLKGELAKAVEAYLSSAKYAQKAGKDITLAAAYTNLSNIYAIQESYLNAVHYNRLAVQIYEKKNNPSFLSSGQINLGEVFRLKGDLDSAEYYFNQGLKNAKLAKKDLAIAYTLGNLGLVYAEKDQVEKAESYMGEAIEKLLVFEDYYPIIVYQTSLAEIYQKRGETQRALDIARQSYEIAKSQGLKEQIRDAGLQLAKLYEVTGDFEKAYHYQSEYIVYRDSIKNEETIMKIADLRTEFEVSKKQREVDFLNKATRNQRTILVGLTIILILGMVLTYLLYKNYKLKVKAHRILSRRKKIIEDQRNELDMLNRTKDRFFSIVSHDLRGPVSSFQGVSELLRAMVSAKEYDQIESIVGKLEKSARQLSLLLDNLLGWALGQQGKFPYHPEKLSLSDVFDSSLGILENMASSKHQKLTYSLDGSLSIWADRDSTLAIFRNLIGNAMKFTPERGSIDFTAEACGDKIKLVVKDTGVGISKEKLSGIFNFKGNKSSWGTRGEKGMGLGLILVHEFVEMNKGEIEVTSEEGVGTEITVWLPLYQGQTS